MKFSKTRLPVENCYSRTKGHAELGLHNRLRTIFILYRFSNEGSSRSQDPQSDLLYLIRPEVIFPHNFQDTIDGRLHITTAGMRFHRGAKDLKSRPDTLQDLASI